MTESAGHGVLGDGRWFALTLMEQLGNIGSEVGRATRAKGRDRPDRMWRALERALELFDLTLRDPRHRLRRKEIARAREVVVDYVFGDNEYHSTAEDLDRYFLVFAMAARRAHYSGRTFV